MDADGNEIDLKQNFDDDYGFSAAESDRGAFSHVNDADKADGFSLEDENGDPITDEDEEDFSDPDENFTDFSDEDEDYLDDEYTLDDEEDFE